MNEIAEDGPDASYQDARLSRMLAASVVQHKAAVGVLKWHLEMEDSPGSGREAGHAWRVAEGDCDTAAKNNWRATGDWRANECDWRASKGNWRANECDWRASKGNWRATEDDWRAKEDDWRATTGSDWRVDGDRWRNSDDACGRIAGQSARAERVRQSEERNAGVRAYLGRKLQTFGVTSGAAAAAANAASWPLPPRSVTLPSPPLAPTDDVWRDRRMDGFEAYDGYNGYEDEDFCVDDDDGSAGPAAEVGPRYQHRQEAQRPARIDTSLDAPANWPHSCRPFFYRRADPPSVRYY